jgi:uncharacterized protein (TIGR01777 family)
VRVGVTGSSGFIGAALVAALEERGDHVTRFVRPESPRRGDSVVRWEPSRQSLDPGDLAKAGGFDAAINLAGAGIADRRWSEERKEQLVRSRIESTTLLVEALRSLPSGVPMLASGSAIGYYGTRGDERLDESSSSGGDFLATLCVGWEQAATPLSQQGSTVALVRTGIVLDRRGGALKKQLPLFRLGLGGRLSSGHQWLSPISLVDEVRALLWAIDRRVAGPVNFVCPTPLNNKEFTKNLASALHRRALVPVPAVALEAALGRQLAIEAVLASQRVVPRVLSESGFTFKHGNGSSIIEAALQP